MIIDFYKKTWHRILLEEKLKENSSFIKGKIIDIGSKNRRYDHLFKGEITSIDIEPNQNLNIRPGNIEKGLKYKKNTFNGVLCIEVLEYIKDTSKSLDEIKRILKPKGSALISIPFFYHEHGDLIRLSPKWFELELSNRFSHFKIFKIGNAYTSIWDIIRKKTMNNRSGLIKKITWVFILLPLLFIIKLFKLDKIEDLYYSGIFIKLYK